MREAQVEDMDKIMGLTLGADDCVTKPFNPLELVAVSRRSCTGIRAINCSNAFMTHGNAAAGKH